MLSCLDFLGHFDCICFLDFNFLILYDVRSLSFGGIPICADRVLTF